jgi:hypothetical protein
MADLMSRSFDVKDLQRRAARLRSTALSLISLFDEEAKRLDRIDEASRLETMRAYIDQQLHQVRRSEDSAQYSRDRVDIISTLGGFALKNAIKQVSKGSRLSRFADRVFKNDSSEERPFGNVLVCIGPEGLPNDVKPVSISQLARESNRTETDVNNDIQKRDFLLLDEKSFHLLIEMLVDDVIEGRRRLPISLKQLSEIGASNTSSLEADGSA